MLLKNSRKILEKFAKKAELVFKRQELDLTIYEVPVRICGFRHIMHSWLDERLLNKKFKNVKKICTTKLKYKNYEIRKINPKLSFLNNAEIIDIALGIWASNANFNFYNNETVFKNVNLKFIFECDKIFEKEIVGVLGNGIMNFNE
jgi:hypothetical protein